jgi:hypothetical protein
VEEALLLPASSVAGTVTGIVKARPSVDALALRTQPATTTSTVCSGVRAHHLKDGR